jgi:hypothetical protein
VAFVGPNMIRNRRAHRRVTAFISVLTEVGEDDLFAATTNVSAGGAFIGSQNAPQQESEIGLQFRGARTASNTVLVRSLVVRTVLPQQSDMPGFGVRWLSAECAYGAERLRDFLAAVLNIRDAALLVREDGFASYKFPEHATVELEPDAGIGRETMRISSDELSKAQARAHVADANDANDANDGTDGPLAALPDGYQVHDGSHAHSAGDRAIGESGSDRDTGEYGSDGEVGEHSDHSQHDGDLDDGDPGDGDLDDGDLDDDWGPADLADSIAAELDPDDDPVDTGARADESASAPSNRPEVEIVLDFPAVADPLAVQGAVADELAPPQAQVRDSLQETDRYRRPTSIGDQERRKLRKSPAFERPSTPIVRPPSQSPRRVEDGALRKLFKVTTSLFGIRSEEDKPRLGRFAVTDDGRFFKPGEEEPGDD